MTPETEFTRLKVFSFIAQIEVLLIWIVYSLLATLIITLIRVEETGIFAFVWLIVFGIPFLQYCFAIMDFASRGNQQAPRMSIEIIALDSRTFKELFLMGMLLGAITATPADYQWITTGVALLIAPAMTSFVVLEGSLVNAANPLKIFRFISMMGLTYVTLRILVTSVLLLFLFVADRHTTLFENIAGRFFFATVGTYLLLTLFRATGALLHSRRDQLGLHTDFSPEKNFANEIDSDQQTRREFLVEVYNLWQGGKQKAAWEMLESAIKNDRYNSEAFYYAELNEWKDPQLAWKTAQGYISRLIEVDPEEAWRIYEEVIRSSNGDYKLGSGSTLLALAENANTVERKRITIESLSNFESDFPGHPKIRQAYLTATDLCCETGNVEFARDLFHKVTHRRGLISKPVYERCRSFLEIDSDS